MIGSEYNYEISITMSGQNIQDVQYCAFIRSAILKQSSFCVVRMYCPQVLITEFNNLLSENIFPDVPIKIYSSTEKDTDRSKRKINNIYSRKLRCIYIKPLDPQAKQTKVHAEMVLVHPTLHYLGNTNTFNDILENTTSYDALQQFEKFLTETHGDIFQFRHINNSLNTNDFIYEQLLIKACNDLNVPTYLIHTYKTHNSFTFYFFDDFYLADDAEKEIVCHYINLFDKSDFKQINIYDNADMSYFTKYLSEKPFCDRFQTLDKQGNAFIHNHQEMVTTFNKVSTSRIIHRRPADVHNISVTDDRTVNVMDNSSLSTIEKENAVTFSRTYVPDSVENAESRFDLSLQMMTKKISRICEFESLYAYPDFPQFGHIYNLNRDQRSDYVYTPINICNVFARKGANSEFLYHTSRSLMVKFSTI